MDLHKYIGKKVGFFMNDKLLKQYKDHVFVQEPPGVLDCLILEYSNKLYLEIKVNKYLFLKQFNIRCNWSLDLFKKEKIGVITIVANNKTVAIIK